MDNRTLSFALMIVAIAVASLGIFLAWGRKDKALNLWAFGFVAVVLGFGLLSLQGFLTPWISIILANSIALGFHFLNAAGIRAYLGRINYWPRRFWVYYGLWIGVLWYFTFVMESYPIRGIGASVLIILLTLEVLLLFKDKALQELPGYVRKFIFTMLVIFCISHFLRILGLFFLSSTSLLNDRTVSSYFFSFSLAYSIIWPGIFWLLDSHRLLKQQSYLGQLKDRIWKMAGHDLRGPLGSLEQYLEVLSDPSKGDYCIEKEDIILMKTTVREVNNLLENLLIVSRTQTHEERALEICDLREVVQAVCDTWTPAAHLKGITLVTDLQGDPRVYGFPEALQGALRNLISNGIKFSSAGTTLSITSEINEGFLLLKVRDQGIGLDPKILEAFSQGDKALPRRKGTANEGGAGFGLTLVRELITPFKGRLEVRNHPQGGAEFTIILPAIIENVRDSSPGLRS